MVSPDQKELFDVLNQQSQNQKRVDRTLYYVLPTIAFLVSVICANLNWQSTLGTFVLLVVAFIAVGIKRQNLKLWLVLVAIYSLIDIYFSSRHSLPIQAIGRHTGTMVTFTGIVGIARPYIDRWLLK